MLKSACIGFCRSSNNERFGTLVEDYLNGKISEQTLQEECLKIKINNWETQKQHGIDIIPSNDFTLYDNMLDSTCLFGNIPRKYYWEGGQVPLDIYFSLARGKQQNKFDVSPLELRRWLNTGYLYHRSECNDNIELTYANNKSVVEYLEAKQIGIETRSAILGPISYLLQNKNKDYDLLTSTLVQDILSVYENLLNNYQRINIKSIQIDEPAICFVADRKMNDLYTYCYNKLREFANGIEIHLVVYYKNIYDNFNHISSLPVDSIHIDIDYNAEYLDNILKQADKKSKLSLGIVSAKSLWKNNLSKSIDIVSKFCDKFGADNIVIANSSPLFLCPYSTKLETEMPSYLRDQLSFAVEKLDELRIIKTAINEGKSKVSSEIAENKKLFEERTIYNNIYGFLDKKYIDTSVIKSKRHTKKNDVFENLLKKYNIKTPIFMLSNVNYSKTLNYEDIQQSYTDIISIDSKCNDCSSISVNCTNSDKCGYYALRHNAIPMIGNFYYQPIIVFDTLKLPENLFINEVKSAKEDTKKPIKMSICGPLEFLNYAFISPFIDIGIVKQRLFNDLAEKINKIIDKIDILQVNESSFGMNLGIKQNKTEVTELALSELNYFLSKINANNKAIAFYCAYSGEDNIFEYISNLNIDLFITDAIRSGYKIFNSLISSEVPIAFGVVDPYSNRDPIGRELLSAEKTITSFVKTNRVYLTTESAFATNKTYDEIKNICKIVYDSVKIMKKNNKPDKQKDNSATVLKNKGLN